MVGDGVDRTCVDQFVAVNQSVLVFPVQLCAAAGTALAISAVETSSAVRSTRGRGRNNTMAGDAA